MTRSHENNKLSETGSEEALTLYLVDKTFKLAVWNILKRPTKTMDKEIKLTTQCIRKINISKKITPDSNRNSAAEKYTNWNKNFTRGIH